jgi:membrane protein
MTDTSLFREAQNPAYRLLVFLTFDAEKHMVKPNPPSGNFFEDLWNFVSKDIWRVPQHQVKGIKNKLLNLFRTLILAIRGFTNDRLSTRASALTYSTLLAVVPVATIIIAIARGFGFEKMIQIQLTKILPGQDQVLEMLFKFVQSYLKVATSGIIIGLGIIFLIASIWSILQSIEKTVNDIFQIKRGRSISRMISDYLATMFLIPVLLIVSSGFSIFIHTTVAKNEIFALFSPFLNVVMTCIPYFFSWLCFSLLYILIPNTKVRVKNAIIAGIIAGSAFQAFQYLYISGQIWVNHYNAIYGSFAAIPLFLLWLQLSWTIVLFGAEICYAAQNVQNYYFERESKSVSHRYRYFIGILIMNILCKRFANGEGPMTMSEISTQYEIPSRLTSYTLRLLLEMHMLSETPSLKEKDAVAYQPAIDINKLTLGYFFDKMFNFGSEDFQIDTEEKYKTHWESLIHIEKAVADKGGNILIKDL